MSKRVLYFKFYEGGSEHYRLKPLDYIDSHELTIVETRDHNHNFLLWEHFDTFLLLRPQGDAAINLIATAKRWHKKVIIDWDDLPTALDQYNPMYSEYEAEKRSTLKCVSMADEVWVATQAIKDSFRLYNKNIHVIPNAHDDYIWPVRNKKPFNYNKIACYRGGESHYGDMYDLGVPEMIIDTVTKNRDWEFRFLGQRFHYLEKRTPDNYISIPGSLPMVQFQEMMHKENACIFFYPLANTTFNRGKSNCSWLEATYAGSAYFGNKDLPEFDKIPIGSIKTDFISTDAESLRIMNQLSWELICDEFLVSNVNKLRLERLLS